MTIPLKGKYTCLPDGLAKKIISDDNADAEGSRLLAGITPRNGFFTSGISGCHWVAKYSSIKNNIFNIRFEASLLKSIRRFFINWVVRY